MTDVARLLMAEVAVVLCAVVVLVAGAVAARWRQVRRRAPGRHSMTASGPLWTVANLRRRCRADGLRYYPPASAEDASGAVRFRHG
jgi:hypothetical protein